MFVSCAESRAAQRGELCVAWAVAMFGRGGTTVALPECPTLHHTFIISKPSPSHLRAGISIHPTFDYIHLRYRNPAISTTSPIPGKRRKEQAENGREQIHPLLPDPHRQRAQTPSPTQTAGPATRCHERESMYRHDELSPRYVHSPSHARGSQLRIPLHLSRNAHTPLHSSTASQRSPTDPRTTEQAAGHPQATKQPAAPLWSNLCVCAWMRRSRSRRRRIRSTSTSHGCIRRSRGRRRRSESCVGSAGAGHG